MVYRLAFEAWAAVWVLCLVLVCLVRRSPWASVQQVVVVELVARRVSVVALAVLAPVVYKSVLVVVSETLMRHNLGRMSGRV